ncbi:MAG: type II toxin-antitoxin system RelE/ParE family toxin [Proteobacteria bacterium]|nr:type II toxin-antitoxin system RelE/ParE family toxin [Pseudomonadota bacterium]
MAGNDRLMPAAFFLTRNAALDLRRIHARSRREWGDDVADRYLADLYAAMSDAAANPEKGRLRQHRAAPFLMVAVRQHFVIYDLVPQGIAVLTVQHQVRDIETLVAGRACTAPGPQRSRTVVERRGQPHARCVSESLLRHLRTGRHDRLRPCPPAPLMNRRMRNRTYGGVRGGRG